MMILSPNEIAIAAELLSSGGILVVPTQRWYMLCGLADDAEVCSRIFSAKRRPRDRQLLFVATSQDDLNAYVAMTSEAVLLGRRLWPGDLAMQLRWRDNEVPRSFSSFDPACALVNVPSGYLSALAAAVGRPLAATSANIAGAASTDGAGPAVSLEEAIQFVEAAELEAAAVIDGGLCPLFAPTTIVDCTIEGTARIVRTGVIHERVIAAALL